ncbi:MAG: methyltransferase domain-containing protein [Verrucomicrobiae bacterium]|nr:methyltransferase domain-containing protein [Verrucomicrobiae bacterium]
MDLAQLTDYIKCPSCDATRLEASPDRILCASCHRSYEVADGIPILTVEEHLKPHERHQIRHYDQHYSAFSATDYRLERWRESMLKRLFENGALGQVSTYLDVGCGATGYTTIEAARRKGWLAFGTDISLQAMQRARSLAEAQGVGDNTAFMVSSAARLPFRKASMDYVSAVSVLEHVEHDAVAAGYIADALRPDGSCFICVPNTYLRMWPFFWPIYWLTDFRVGHKRHYSIERLDALMSGLGMRRAWLAYNGHLEKVFQLFRERYGTISDADWWRIEDRDVNLKSIALQLNAVYRKSTR